MPGCKVDAKMALWPFRRKSNRRPSRGALRSQENMSQPNAGTDNGLERVPSGSRMRKSRTSSRGNRMPSKDSRGIDKRRAYSFSSGRNDSIMVRGGDNPPPVPPLPPGLMGKGMSNPQNPLLSHTQPADPTQEWQRVPTLHKRSAQEMSRRKSSKKRKEEHTREAEIKAMSASMPTRPATDSHFSGRPMKRESKRMRGGLNRSLQNPSSDISLPTAESIRSSLSSDAEQSTSYKVSTFYILAPRPTIRYSENPRHASGASLGSDHPESQKRKVLDRMTISEEVLKANKRVDDLADDLNAGELRELMERDQKRRERKRAADRIKIEKRLARRQEQQRNGEATAERTGTPPPANMERGVMGREVLDQGIGTSAIITSSVRRDTLGLTEGKPEPVRDTVKESTALGSKKSMEASSSEPSRPITKVAELKQGMGASVFLSSPPVVESDTKITSGTRPKAESPMPKTLAPFTSRVTAGTTAPAQSERLASETTTRPSQSWTSFFRRSSKPKRSSNPVPPPSFSNTSRDSMQTSQQTSQPSTQKTPQGAPVGYAPVKMSSNIPKRTMSKFREDLPELPLSPPDSRVQSPEVDIVPPIPKEFFDKRSGARSSSDDTHMRYDTPTSGYRSLETGLQRDETPNSADRSVDVPSPEPATLLSQSLASIDSEGSWLSGRKNSKRESAQLSAHRLRDSASSLHKRYRDYADSTEELGIAEDEYFTRLTPGIEEDRAKRQSTGNPMPSSDEEDGDGHISPIEAGRAIWGAVGRHPTVVHREPRAKSREGLLNDFEYDSGSDAHGEALPDVDRDSKDSGDSEVRVHRATSIDLGIKHARHISAGSARLLDLKARNSGDGKRLSLGSDLG